MRSYKYDATEEQGKTVLGRQAENNAPRKAAGPAKGSETTSGNPFIAGGLTTNGHSVVQRSLFDLQQRCGNQCAQRAMHLARKSEASSDVTPDVERKIESARGGGQPLDSKVGAQMGEAFNADFSGVRVHTGGEADSLNQSLNAKAFTTGQDVFFRDGEYNPGSSSGRGLLAHELTHVVQQNGGKVERKSVAEAGPNTPLQRKLSVGSPNDIYEQEADQMAQAFTSWEQRGKGNGEQVRRQAVEEEKKEEEPLMAKVSDGSISRQPEQEPEKEKEELVSTKQQDGVLQRQPETEEEEV